MIAVDTSALMAILLGEPTTDACAEALEIESDFVILAGTLAEALVVASRRGGEPAMRSLIHDLGFRVVSLTEESAVRVAHTCRFWGKGVRPTCLNFVDSRAYELAAHNGCPLLYVAGVSAFTDLTGALPEMRRNERP